MAVVLVMIKKCEVKIGYSGTSCNQELPVNVIKYW